jgi:rod shape-determining protein MreC
LTAQLPLTVCFLLALVIALLGRAEASIFNSARTRLMDFSAPALAATRGPLQAFETLQGNITAFFGVYGENARLKRENAELRKWQNVALALEQRNHRYELLLNAIPDPQLASSAVRVIGQSNRPFVKTMILNAGTKHRIRKGQAVVADQGLIGRIYLAGDRSSWVLLLTDPSSRVPVRIQPSNSPALLVGDNTVAPRLELDSSERPAKAGDRVLSTGDGGLLPPDLPVGTVVADGDTLRVALFADADLSDYVHVVDYTAPLEPPANDPEDLPPGRRPLIKAKDAPAVSAPAAAGARATALASADATPRVPAPARPSETPR